MAEQNTLIFFDNQLHMNQGKYIFSQIMELISYKQLRAIVNRHFGDYKVKNFSCWKQFLCMAFGQLTHRESLSDTMMCLKATTNKMYHVGIGEVVATSAITRANERVILFKFTKI